ncbi:hypothetical protein U14_00236 [Candidatus Moduliflexus flocculans]|uniref:DUF4097 domain-containing protein n=1 Tax=Candidatus Moduliflexus flocculans TaxID=1499966 RepID=A0A0S6VPL6_9BACT|nr:hypothetical protein U14_00236 [Candidatus Moduliflexus flocculans]
MRIISCAMLSLFVICCAAPALAQQVEKFHRVVEVAAGTTLNVTNTNGNVTITAWDKPTVDITAIKKCGFHETLENARIDVLQPTEKTLEIKTVLLMPRPKISVQYEIKTPAGMLINNINTSNGSLDIRNVQGKIMSLNTSDGSIALQGVSGDQINAKTSDGSITAKSIVGAATVKSSDGSITAEEMVGSIFAKTSNGSIKLHQVSGEVNAETSNGSIEIRGASLLNTVKTSDGSIQADILKTQTANATFETSDGSINLSLAPELQAAFEMKTSDGRIKLNDITLNVSEIAGDNALKGTLNNGGAMISLKTSDGNIELFPLQ